MDLLYFESPPGLQLLHCLKNSVTGGTSLFYDVFGAVQRLKDNYPKYYKVLCDTPVRFHYENDEKYFEYMHYTIKSDLNDGVQVFYSPQFQGPLHAPANLINEFYQAFAAFEMLLADEKYLFRHLLKPGQVAIFANRRVLHGREAFDHTSGERWLKGTYVGWDEFKDRVRMSNIPDKAP
jgi:gamma-butyrobetaine dioxygenase